ncbi:MAG: Gfo/Idh/MocA family oxidoreductase [Verrucomicrobia bacterium]|nr:Gfo/Idh/MocA family oxidoreductase [Verrucomicrobiota bacterium]
MKTQLRTGIIGVGAVVREIYQYLYFRSHYSDLLDIRAVADPNAEYRNWFCDLAGIPPERRFADYREMLQQVELDAVQVNTPDHLHCAPTVAALQAGLDVIVPKPTAATIQDTHAMIAAARQSGRFLGIDFHKREDPRLKEAEARYQNGRYGTLQTAVFYMIDKLLVADPNHSPRFFASADFAEKNTPISFLTVHMADALMKVVNLIPVRVRATGYAQKLPSLQPIAVRGYDTVDTEVVFQNGATAHIITGWAVPNSAHATTVQSGRLLCTDGVIDLGLDQPGLREIHRDGIFEVNPLFRNFEKDNTVTGYGISSPGRLYQQALALRNGRLPEAQKAAAFTPMALGFYTTAVLEAAESSLAEGEKTASGVTFGRTVDLPKLVSDRLGAAAARDYGY